MISCVRVLVVTAIRRGHLGLLGLPSVSLFLGGSTCGSPSSPRVGPPERVRLAALKQGKMNGDPSPILAQYTFTNALAAVPVVGIGDNGDVSQLESFVTLVGRFSDTTAYGRPGAAPLSGDTIVFTLHAGDHIVNDFGIQNGAPDTRSVGPLTTFSLFTPD
jgi:hypothetical protein